MYNFYSPRIYFLVPNVAAMCGVHTPLGAVFAGQLSEVLGLGGGFGCGFLIYVQLIFGGALLAYEKHSLSRACGISLGNFLWVEGFLRLGFRLGLGFCWGAFVYTAPGYVSCIFLPYTSLKYYFLCTSWWSICLMTFI